MVLLIALLTGYVVVRLECSGRRSAGCRTVLWRGSVGNAPAEALRPVGGRSTARSPTGMRSSACLRTRGRKGAHTFGGSFAAEKARASRCWRAFIFTILVGLAFGGQRALAFVHDSRRGNPPDSVVVLTASWCGHCMRLREVLASNRIPYTDVDVEKSAEGRWAFTAIRGTGVPITIVGEQVVRGTRLAGYRPGPGMQRAIAILICPVRARRVPSAPTGMAIVPESVPRR